MELFRKKEYKEDSTIDMGRGCEFCSCDESGDIKTEVCEGCFKLHVTDWLKDYPANLPGDIFEVRFKNTRRGYYRNVNNLLLKEGDIVAVEASPGHDIGIVSLMGDMVARQMKRVGFVPQNGEFKKIYRKAKPYDIEKWQEAITLEHETMIKARQIAAEMNLNMKIGDVEYQGDKIKAIFYYIADERVDFRELIKVFAEVFHIRVEMKQIGARQEAGRIGGIGSCGRELCCASWISSFLSVTTNAARTQDISLNPQKLAGQCSKLKCCLIYEYDDYMDSRKEFPKISGPLYVMDGEYHFVKNDILAHTMSFSTAPGSMSGLVTIPIERVKEVMRLNNKGVKPDSLEGDVTSKPKISDPGYVNVIGEDSITRFDSNRKKKNGKSKERNGNNKQSRPNGKVKEADTEVRTESTDKGKNNNKSKQGNNRSAKPNTNQKPATKEQGEQRKSPQKPKQNNSQEKQQRSSNTRGKKQPEKRDTKEGGAEQANKGEKTRSENKKPQNSRTRPPANKTTTE